MYIIVYSVHVYWKNLRGLRDVGRQIDIESTDRDREIEKSRETDTY